MKRTAILLLAVFLTMGAVGSAAAYDSTEWLETLVPFHGLYYSNPASDASMIAHAPTKSDGGGTISFMFCHPEVYEFTKLLDPDYSMGGIEFSWVPAPANLPANAMKVVVGDVKGLPTYFSPSYFWEGNFFRFV